MPSHFPIGGELAARRRMCAPLLLCSAILLAAGTTGCPKKLVWATVPKPAPVQRSASVLPEPPEVHPEEPGEIELAYVTLEPPPAPPEPAAHAPAPSHHASDSAPSTRPAPPQISPQISPADQEAYQKRTNDSISEAQKNLQHTSGHQLSSSQQEMVDKIRAFISQAQDAVQSDDYPRAQNLAQKAQLLSVELVNTL